MRAKRVVASARVENWLPDWMRRKIANALYYRRKLTVGKASFRKAGEERLKYHQLVVVFISSTAGKLSG
jgi:hypothetical protein